MADVTPLKLGSNGLPQRFQAGDTLDPAFYTSGGGSSPSVISPAQITADQNDYEPTGWADATTVRLSFNSDTRAIRSFAAATSGERKTLVNVGTFPGFIVCEHPSGTAANRVLGATDHVLWPSGVIEIEYDGTSSRWRVISNTFAPSMQEGAVSYWHSVGGSITAADISDLGFATSGTGAGVTTSSPQRYLPAGRILSTGSTALGLATMHLAKTVGGVGVAGYSYLAATGAFSLEEASVSTQRFTFQAALTGSPTGAILTANNTVGIRYSDNINSGKFEFFSRNSSGEETVVDTGVTVGDSVGNDAYSYAVSISPDLSEARCYINGLFVGRITSNLPATDAALGHRVGIFKSVGTDSGRVFVSKMTALAFTTKYLWGQ